MFSPQERLLISVIVLVLLLGVAVKGCRTAVKEEAIPAEPLPTLDDSPEPKPDVD
jgi:hypothetical protein